MQGITLKSIVGVVHFDMTDEWKDTPENRQKLLEDFESGDICKHILSKQELNNEG